MVNLLTAKQKRIEKILDIYKPLKLQLEEIRNAFSAISEKLSRQNALKKKEALFQRSASPLLALNIRQLEEEMSAIVDKTRRLFSVDFWTSGSRSFWESAGHRILSALVLYAGILWGMLRFRKICRRYEQSGQLSRTPWRHLSYRILDRSLILTGTTAFVAGYMTLQTESAEIAMWKIAPDFLWLWLLTRWGLTGIHNWSMSTLPAIPERISNGLCFGLRAIRFFGMVYLGLEWLLDGVSDILLLARMLFGVGLLAGYIRFWKSVEPYFSAFSERFRHFRPIAIGAGYTIAGLGPVLELIGYGHLALYWYTSWGITLITCFWGALLMMTLRNGSRTSIKFMNRSRQAGVQALYPAVAIPATVVADLLSVIYRHHPDDLGRQKCRGRRIFQNHQLSDSHWGYAVQHSGIYLLGPDAFAHPPVYPPVAQMLREILAGSGSKHRTERLHYHHHHIPDLGHRHIYIASNDRGQLNFPYRGFRCTQYRTRLWTSEYFQQFHQRHYPALRAAHSGRRCC